ncbi:hypothetical protein jhhlp_000442 [Lomentospora prolificans]|uniref:JmjC domain-containing protein n=1 Tax=Lomentospora prolificans TaxID=41688 RepID=A0A2N3NL30_9PEZI|nr:hypothetical protein jhhlp_000442 [Lomentospora prolificans]
MPTSLHPQAKFDPIPPDLDLHALVENAPNLSWAVRISTTQIRNLSQNEFENLVNIHVVHQGRPLVISGWDEVLPKHLFSAEWLENTYNKRQEIVRDLNSQKDIPMTLGHYMRSMKQLTKQWNSTNFRDERRQRLYLKDIDCPPEWHKSLQKIIPPNIFYMNENVTDKNNDEATSNRDDDMFRTQIEAAPAGDLMSCLPEEMRAQNLMCYIGHEGTYTPAHREMCASLGQNLMVEASRDEDDERAGSSIWFMTETKDREVVREYFLSMLGHDIEIEKHFAQINAWKKATFPVYVVEQKPGDFILVPPLAAHQVWNRGTRTMKVAWNRTTVETLEMAMREALPKAKLVCRDEQYKNKAIIYYALKKYAAELSKSGESDEMGLLGLGADLIRSSPRTEQLAQDFKRLFALFSDILTDEMFATKEKGVEFLPFDSCITCSYCRCNIFNRFLTCKHCIRPLINGDEDTYDVCMECYAMGRSCFCVSGLQWCEQWNWSDLVDQYEHWRAMIIRRDGFVDLETSPMPLEVARSRRGKKSLAQVCQESLKRRPFKDIFKPEVGKEPSESEPELDDEGRPRKKITKRKKRKTKQGDTRRCHVCCHRDYAYRVQVCSNPDCNEGYCYGVLYRAFDMMPQAVQESEYWECPKCLGICNCGGCRRSGNSNPYIPKNTLLGHDTRRIADDRSVETLVDFRMHNLTWLKVMGEESRSNNSKRMQRLREQADIAKSQGPALVTDEVLFQKVQNGSGPPLLPLPSANGQGVESTTNANPGFSARMDPDGLDSDEHHQEGLSLPPDHPVALAETSLLDEHDNSNLYPESMLGPQRMIGMGYYEQDDSPDKILFDEYQAPTAESMVLDEPDISEYLRKSIRAAKRKARQEDEDPEFKVRSRYEKKKQKRTDKNEGGFEFIEVDPALFATPGKEANHGQSQTTSNGVVNESDGDDSSRDGDSDELAKHSTRGAKPQHSYAETDDLDEILDDPENLIQTKAPSESPRRPTRDPNAPPKRRGRPPKRATVLPAVDSSEPAPRRRELPRSQLSHAISADDLVEEAEPEPIAPEAVGAAGQDDYRTLDDELQMLAADLEKELERGSDGDEEQIANEASEANEPSVSQFDTASPPLERAPKKRKRGRPPRTETSILAQFEEELTPAKTKASASVSTPKTEPAKRGRGRPRGRPRRSEPVMTREPSRSPSPPTTTTPMKMMSMAERMRLKGKKFKIAQRKLQGSPSSSIRSTLAAASVTKPKAIVTSKPAIDQENEILKESQRPLRGRKEVLENDYSPASGDRDSESSNDDSHSDAEPPELPSPPRGWTVAGRSSGPTIVRLSDAEEEEEEEDEEPSPMLSTENDSDDEIPARRASAEARMGEEVIDVGAVLEALTSGVRLYAKKL